MEQKNKKRLNTLTSIALLLSTIPFAKSEQLATQSNESNLQKQWLHVDESQGQGLWQLQSIDQIRPELSRMPSRKQRSEYNKPINYDAMQIEDDLDYHGAPNSQLLQINQEQKFLGEPVRWIKCAFIDCEAVNANKKKVQDKIDLEKKIKQDKLDKERREREEREARERQLKKKQTPQQPKKETKPEPPKVEKKEEPKKEEKKEELKKEDKKVEPKVETPPKKKEEKPTEEKPKDLLKNEPKVDDTPKTETSSGSLFDSILSKPKDDPTSKYTSSSSGDSLGALGGLLTNTQLKEDVREQNEFEGEDPSYLKNNQEMTQLGMQQKSNIQLSVESNLKRKSISNSKLHS